MPGFSITDVVLDSITEYREENSEVSPAGVVYVTEEHMKHVENQINKIKFVLKNKIESLEIEIAELCLAQRSARAESKSNKRKRKN